MGEALMRIAGGEQTVTPVLVIHKARIRGTVRIQAHIRDDEWGLTYIVVDVPFVDVADRAELDAAPVEADLPAALVS